MGTYNIKEIPTEEFGELWTQHAKGFFEDESQIFRLRDHLDKDELQKCSTLNSRIGDPIRINLGVYCGDEFVGWSWGFQESATRFYMCNSAIFPEHRRKGLYTKLLRSMVDRVSKHGFQEIYSRHVMTNNSVIIAKLKEGFVITTFEVSDLFGSLVHLTYYQKDLRRKMLKYRTGQIKPDEEIKDILKL